MFSTVTTQSGVVIVLLQLTAGCMGGDAGGGGAAGGGDSVSSAHRRYWSPYTGVDICSCVHPVPKKAMSLKALARYAKHPHV